MTESSDYESVQVFIGVDVGKDTHHAVAINRSGKRLFDKALPNDENKLRSLISDLKQHGQILLVVDQPATIGALPVASAIHHWRIAVATFFFQYGWNDFSKLIQYRLTVMLTRTSTDFCDYGKHG